MTAGRSRLRRVLTWAGIALGALLLLIAAGFAFLFTDPGERLLDDRLIAAVEQRTGQKVEIGRLEFHADRVVLHDVKAATAEGAPTFAAEEAEVDLKLKTLLGRGVHLDKVALTHFRIHLRRGEPGAAAEQAPAEEKRGSPSISVDQLALNGGTVEILKEGGALQLRIEELRANGSLARGARIWSGALEVRGEVTHPARVPLELSAAAKAEGGIQTARIDAGSGQSRLHADLQLPVPDRRGKIRLAQVNGRLDLAIPRFSSSGFRYGPMRAAARFDNGRLFVQQLHLELPGLVVTRDDTDAGAFSGKVKISDLEAATEAIEALAGRSLPDLSGQGELHVRLDNPITAAGLQVDGQLATLGWGELQARQVKLEGQLADLTEPSQGKLALEAGSVLQGGRQLRAVSVKVRNEARRSTLDATVGEPMPTTVQLTLEQPGGAAKPMRLQRFVLSYPEATWRQEGGPARIRLADQEIEIEGLQLVSDEQKIAVEGAWGNRKKNVNLSLTALRLERLPPLLLPGTLDPAGRVDGELKLTAPRGQLAGTANVTVSQAQVQGLTGLTGRLTARFAGDRLEGSVTGSALGGSVEGRFELPASAAAKNQQLTAHLTLEGASVGGVWRWAERRVSKDVAAKVEDPAGRLSAKVDVEGSAAEPSVKAQVAVDEGAITYVGADRFTGLTVRGEAEVSGRQLKLPFLRIRTAEGGLQVSGTGQAAGAGRPIQYKLDVTAERFPLPFEEPMLATLKATVTGTASSGRITSKVSVSNMKLEEVTARQAPRAALDDIQ